jgi:hypothetical protein
MLESKLSRALLLLGATVGVVGVVVTALEVPFNLPDWMVRVALLKLSFVAAAGLLAAGALVGRHAKASTIRSGAEIPQLGEGESPRPDQARPDRTPQGVPRGSDTPR